MFGLQQRSRGLGEVSSLRGAPTGLPGPRSCGAGTTPGLYPFLEIPWPRADLQHHMVCFREKKSEERKKERIETATGGIRRLRPSVFAGPVSLSAVTLSPLLSPGSP